MGLTLAEAGSLVLGAALIVRFLLRVALPQARTRFVSATNRHSSDLREEFVLLPPARIAAALLASGPFSRGRRSRRPGPLRWPRHREPRRFSSPAS